MKALLALMLAGLPFVADAQADLGSLALPADSVRALRELRFEKLQRWVLEAPRLSDGLKNQLIASNDHDLVHAALGDLSAPTAVAATRNVEVRVRMHQLSRLAETDAGKRALEGTRWSADLLRRLSVGGAAPVAEYESLKEFFGVDAQNRLMLRPGVLVVNPEPPIRDDVPRGRIPDGYRVPPLWRKGLLYAVSVGMFDGSAHRAFCSGTIVDKYWVVTAAHCLWDGKGGRVQPARLSVYAPFQGGATQVVNAMGKIDRDMRALRVLDTSWLGDSVGKPFPLSKEDIDVVAKGGMDIALLKLDAQEVDLLPASIDKVKVGTTPGDPPVSMVGYGFSNKPVDGLSLAVGVRSSLPRYMQDNADAVQFASPSAAGNPGGLCGGDSGGGLFSGRIDGAIGQKPVLLAVMSGLSGVEYASDVQVCLGAAEWLSSLLTARNRGFVCGKAQGAC